jgi:hypothetical protein
VGALIAGIVLVAATGCSSGSESARRVPTSTTPSAATGPGAASCRPRVDTTRSELPRIPPNDDAHLHHHAAPRLNPADARAQRGELDRARLAAAQLGTVARALAAGYVPTGGSEGDGDGVHFTNWSLVTCRFDPAHPSQLLYDGSTADAPLVAFSYYLVSAHTPPSGFAGDADRWHRHFGICVRGGAMLDRLRPQGHETLRSCRAAGGRVLDGRDLWMLHAWVVPRWTNRLGVFAPLNPELMRD